jgi:hypothetical protein
LRFGVSFKAFAALIALATACGCGSARPSPAPVAAASSWSIPDPPRRGGRPLLLIVMPDSPPFHLVRKSVLRELQGDFDVVTRVVDATTLLPQFSAQVAELRPTGLLVMDNPALALYEAYAESRPDSDPAPPAIVSMTPFFIEELRRIRNTTGVAYEIPGVTAFVKLRSVLARPVRKVAVVHRARFRQFIERQARLAAKEDIVLVPLEVATEPTATEVRAALSYARESQIDALWVLSDRRLLKSARFIKEVWRPQINLFRVPVIVGLSTLVTGKSEFGNFAVVPDHEELGLQTARLIFRVAESGWRADEHPVELPIATRSIANLNRLGELVRLQADAASQVDEVVE